MADKEEQLNAMSSKLNSLEAEMSNLHASNDQLTQHNADSQRLMADREAQSAQLKAQVGGKSSAIRISRFPSFVSRITRTIYSGKHFPTKLRLTESCIYTWLSRNRRTQPSSNVGLRTAGIDFVMNSGGQSNFMNVGIPQNHAVFWIIAIMVPENVNLSRHVCMKNHLHSIIFLHFPCKGVLLCVSFF